MREAFQHAPSKGSLSPKCLSNDMGTDVENAYSSIDSSLIAFARRGLASGINPSGCKADAERLCSGIAPGEGKIIACLKQHKNEVSVGCAKALKAMKAKRGA